MSDRELLEWAAKAAGLQIDKSPYNGGGFGNDGFDFLGNAVLDWHNGTKWNPLTDDGDALRLAVKLRLNLHFEGFDGVEYACAVPHKSHQGQDEPIGDDEAEATRRAIVRAAAEIGRCGEKQG